MPSFRKALFFATATNEAVVGVRESSDTSVKHEIWDEFPPRELVLKSTKDSTAVRAHKAFKLRWLADYKGDKSSHMCELSFDWDGYKDLSNTNKQQIAQAFCQLIIA